MVTDDPWNSPFEAHYAMATAMADSELAIHMTRSLIILLLHLRNEGIHDFSDVYPSTVRDYAESLYQRVLDGDFSLSYAVNCLSAVNCVMRIMRDDNWLWVSPRKYLGPRLFVRASAPETIDLRVVEASALHLEANGQARLAGVLRLCSIFGLRYRGGIATRLTQRIS